MYTLYSIYSIKDYILVREEGVKLHPPPKSTRAFMPSFRYIHTCRLCTYIYACIYVHVYGLHSVFFMYIYIYTYTYTGDDN